MASRGAPCSEEFCVCVAGAERSPAGRGGRMAGRERSELRSDGAQHVSTYRAWLAAFFTLLTRLLELYCGWTVPKFKRKPARSFCGRHRYDIAPKGASVRGDISRKTPHDLKPVLAFKSLSGNSSTAALSLNAVTAVRAGCPARIAATQTPPQQPHVCDGRGTRTTLRASTTGSADRHGRLQAPRHELLGAPTTNTGGAPIATAS